MNLINTLLAWRPKTPFFYGWLILGTSASGAFVATSIAGVVLGGIQGLILEDTGWSPSTIGLAASAGVWTSGLAAPFVGRLAARYGPRWLMPIGTIVLGICLITIGGVHSTSQFIIAAIIGRAISQPILIGVVPRTLAVNFFQRKRNMALALTGMFRPISAAIIIQVISVIYGWRTAFHYLGIVSLALSLPMFLIIRRQPEDLGMVPDGSSPLLSSTPNPRLIIRTGATPGSRPTQPGTSVEPDPEPSWTARAALRTRAFWMVAFATFLAVTGSSAIGFSLVPYLHQEANVPIAQAVGVLSLSTFLALANLIWGYLADKFTPRWCMVVAMACSTAVILYLVIVRTVLMAYAFGAVWGILSSSTEVLISMILAQYFGRRSYGAITGALRPFEAGGLGLGQALGPLIFQVTGNFYWLMVTSVSAYAVATLLIFLAPPRARV